MATFNPNSYGSKKSKIYTAGATGGASAAQNKETSAPSAFDPSRYGSRTSKLYTPSRRGAPQTAQQAPQPRATQTQTAQAGGKQGEKKSGVNVWQLIGDTAKKGLNEIAKGGGSLLAAAEDVLLAPAELLSGKKLGTYSDKGLFNRWNDSISREGAAVDAASAENIKDSKAAQKVYEYGSATINAVPQALMAIFTAGGSEAVSAANMARQAAAQASPGVAGTVTRAVQNMAKDKNFWTAASQVVGRSYEDAVADGATMDKALLYAIGNGLMNAAVEVGGGVQTLPAQLRGGSGLWKAWVDTMLDEGKEEVVQGVIERAMQNTVYGRDNPIVGIGNGAIFDPAAAAKEFAGGAVVGGILGGGQIGVQQLMGRAGRQQATQEAQNRQNAPLSAAQEAEAVPGVNFDAESQNAAERLTEPNTVGNENAPAPADNMPMQAQESSPVQGAGNSRQQVDAPLAPLGVSATQESKPSVPQSAGNYKGLDELLGKAKGGRVSSEAVTGAVTTEAETEALYAALRSGAYGIDANDNLYRMNPDEHIDNRERSTVGDRRLNAFQFDHPELHRYFAEAAEALRYDMGNTQRGGEVYQVPDRDGDWRPRYLRTRRDTTDAIAKLKDDDHLTYDQIEAAIDAIINDKGQENYAAAKRVELILDDMLSNGYTGSDGRYSPNVEYLRRKAEIAGARTDETAIDNAENERAWRQRMDDEAGGTYEGKLDAQQAAADAEASLPEGWERRYDGQEPPLRQEMAEAENSPFPAGGSDGLGGADRGTLNSDFQNMQAESSAFHDVNRNSEERLRREQGRAPSEVPEVNPDTKQSISKTVSTILNAPITSNEMAPVLEQSVAGGRFDYMPVTDQAAMDTANRIIDREGGYEKAAARFTAKVELGQRVTKEDYALGVQCYNEAVAAGDAAAALELAGDLADAARTGAQVTQAVNLLNRLTPAGKLLTLRRYVDKLNRENRPKQSRKRSELTADERRAAFVDEASLYAIDEQLATDYMMAETDEARSAAWQAIIDDIASRVKPTVKEKWDYWRYTSMLTNPVTHIRNLAGNSVQMLMRKTKNAVGAALETAAVRDTDQRTKALLNRGEADMARRALAEELYEQDKAQAMGAGKYKEGSAGGIAREIEDSRKMFGEKYKLGKAVQWVGEKNTAALDWGDALFNKPAYIESLAQAMKARGITAEEARGGAKAELMESARAYAAQEAAKATYRDFNYFSDAVTRLNRLRESDNRLVRAAGVAADAVLPFRRTPANVLVRGVAEYSPIGLARGIKQATLDVRSGEKTAAEAIDTLSAGLTGTGIMLLGALLAKNGLLHTRAGDDDKEERFLKSVGYQDFALQIGDTSYTLDWMTPAAMPLFAGAAMMESVAGDKRLADALEDSLAGIGDVVLETSMLSSLDSLIENAQYAESKPWYLLTQPIISYLSQGVPTIGGKIANVLDDTVRKAYVPKDTGDVAGDVAYFWQSLARKVPGGRSALQPSVDVWGREISNGSLGERLAESFISPGFISTAKDDAVTDEVRRLADKVGSGLYPKQADKSFTFGGNTVYLDGEQYTQYAKTLGQKRHELLGDALKLDGYKAMSDADKARLVSTMYEYANAKAKQKAAPGYTLDAEMQKYADAEAAGMSAAEWYVLKKSADTDGSGGTTQKEAQAALDKTGLTDKEKADLFPLFNRGWKKNPYK